MRLNFQPDGRVLVHTGKVELGQGILTALGQIAADALGLAPVMVTVLAADTALSPDEGVTSGSLSVQDAGRALREACALHRPEGAAQTPPVAAIGQSWPRLDLPAKLRGLGGFIHDLRLPGMLQGRVLHPPRQDAELDMASDGVANRAVVAAAAAMPGVLALHQDGRLFGLLAGRSADADRAADRLAQGLRWLPLAPMESDHAALQGLTRRAASTRVVAEQPASQHATVQRRLRLQVERPAIAHASLAPSCALACWSAPDTPDEPVRLTVWCHSQGIFHLRCDLALAFGLLPEQVRVRHVAGAGCYGHNGADDVAFDAAWLARHAPGRPVRVLWTRQDEFRLPPFGPPMVVDVEVDLGAAGELLHWRQQVYSAGHSSRPGRSATPALLGSWQTATPFAPPEPIDMPLASGGGAERNALPGYALPAWQLLCHRVAAAPLRSSALRSLGAFCNVWAIEAMVDEIALATGVDPLAWRQRHLAHDPRALAVLALVAEQGGWAGRAAFKAANPDGGLGLGLARYKGTGAWCAVLAQVLAGAQLQVQRLTIAVDIGQVVNPDGASAQIEGGAIQATSWALKEAVRFDGQRISSDSWAEYPILRFSEVPELQVLLLPSDQPSLGAGEAALGPTMAAIANALAHALGLRVNQLPYTPENLAAAIHAAPGI